ncbi:hypothetical protein MMJ09_23150, partial [Bacillus vallismortis]|nr:hypothetical protein [Bacillus vallismortis]
MLRANFQDFKAKLVHKGEDL